MGSRSHRQTRMCFTNLLELQDQAVVMRHPTLWGYQARMSLVQEGRFTRPGEIASKPSLTRRRRPTSPAPGDPPGGAPTPAVGAPTPRPRRGHGRPGRLRRRSPRAAAPTGDAPGVPGVPDARPPDPVVLWIRSYM